MKPLLVLFLISVFIYSRQRQDKRGKKEVSLRLGGGKFQRKLLVHVSTFFALPAGIPINRTETREALRSLVRELAVRIFKNRRQVDVTSALSATSPVVAVAGTAFSVMMAMDGDSELKSDYTSQIADLQSQIDELKQSVSSLSTEVNSLKSSSDTQNEVCPLVSAIQKQASMERVKKHCGYAEDCYIYDFLLPVTEEFKKAADSISACGQVSLGDIQTFGETAEGSGGDEDLEFEVEEEEASGDYDEQYQEETSDEEDETT